MHPRQSSQSTAVPEPAVRDQLSRLVSSPSFASSVRLCRFLTHIVNRTLDGDLDSLKEFSIAMEVFDRNADYDPNVDAIVRVEARRLRTKLKAYYEKTQDPVVIELRPGSYVPVFRWHLELERPPTDPGRRTSVAVLPFVNMSPEPEQEFFCDGITEEIINSLTRVAGLDVIARTSAFQFKGVAIDIRDVGQRLAADLVIEGSVRKANDQLRITAQAVETASGHHLWSETFQHKLEDVFAVQQEIAGAVAGLLRVQSPAHAAPPRNLDAFTGYLRARFLIHQQTPESLRAAVDQFRQLVAAFPGYAPAYSGLAAANGLLCHFGIKSGRDVYHELKACAERGYALDPDSAETCTVLGGLRSWWEHQWDESQRMYDRALVLQPAHADAHMYRGMTLLCNGHVDEAESSLRRCMELNPLSASDYARTGYLHYVKGECASAADHFRRACELHTDYAEARFYEGLLHFQQEQYQNVVDRLSRSDAPLDIGLLAAAESRLGRKAAASRSIGRLRQLAERQFVTPLGHGLAAIGMADFDAAFEQLGEAIEDRTNFVNLLAVEPFFNPLRSDSRFPKFLEKLNLSQ